MAAFIVAVITAIFPLMLVTFKYLAEKNGHVVVALSRSLDAASGKSSATTSRLRPDYSPPKLVGRDADKVSSKSTRSAKASRSALHQLPPKKQKICFMKFVHETPAAQMALKSSLVAISVGIVMWYNFMEDRLIGVDLVPTVMQVSYGE